MDNGLSFRCFPQVLKWKVRRVLRCTRNQGGKWGSSAGCSCSREPHQIGNEIGFVER